MGVCVGRQHRFEEKQPMFTENSATRERSASSSRFEPVRREIDFKPTCDRSREDAASRWKLSTVTLVHMSPNPKKHDMNP